MADRPAIVDPDQTDTEVAVKERPAIVNPDVSVEGKRPPIVEPQNYLEFAQESGIDEQKAKGYEDATVNKMAFEINTNDSMRSKTGLNMALSHSPQAGVRKRDTKTLYQGVSTLGAAFQYPTKPEHVRLPSDRLGPEQVKRYADIYLEQGRITEEEHKNVIKSDNPGENLFNIDAVYTTAYPPLPKHFYDKGLGERVSEAPGAFAGGVNYSLGGFFHGVQWLQGETGVNIGAKGVADWLDDNAEIALRGVRQDFGTDLWGAVGSMSTLVIPAAGVGKVARFAGLTERVALTLEVSSATAGEALMEAGGTYNQVIEGGGTQAEANRAARISFGSNVALIGVTNRLGLYRNRFDDMAKKSGGKFGKVSRAAAEGATGEFAQEAGQEVIGQVAKGEPIDLDAAAYAGFIGAFVGGGTSALMTIAADKIDDIGPIPPEVERVYDETVQTGLDAGLSDEQANVQASQAIQDVEGGPAYTDKVMQAQEAVTQAEAAMGRDVEAPIAPVSAEKAAAPVELADIAEQVEAGTLTEDEAIAEIERRLTAPVEAAPAEVAPETIDDLFDVSNATPEQQAEFNRLLERTASPEVKAKEQADFDALVAKLFDTPEKKTAFNRANIQAEITRGFEERKPAKTLRQVIEDELASPLARADALAEGRRLLDEEGAIDLNNPIALDLIKNRLSNFVANPREGLDDVTAIGRAIFDEGKVSLADFTTRMQEILGDLWTQFKDIARQAWEIVNNERGEITIGPEGAPEFDINFGFENIRLQVKHGRNNPAFMEDNPTWSEEEVVRALEKAEKGREITEREAEIVHAALAEAGANFYQEVMTSEDDFINPREFLEEGELDAIIEQEVTNFVSRLQIVTPVTLTAEQKATKERTKTIRERGAEIKQLQNILEEKTALLHQAVLDTASRTRLAKDTSQAAKQESKRLESKIATRDAKIESLRGQANAAAKGARAFIKGRTGAELAQIRATEVTGTPAQREAIKAALQAARSAFRAGNVEGITTEGTRLREIFETARGKRESTARRNQLKKQIKKELRTAKAKLQGGKPVGKFTPEVQNTLDMLRAAANLNPIEALSRVNDNLARYPNTIPPDDVVLENRVISMVHDFGTRTVPQLETLLAEIKALKDEGSMINELRKFNRQARNEVAQTEAIDDITGGKGLPASISAGEKAARAEFDRTQGLTDRAKRWFSTTGKTIVGWKDILDILSRLSGSPAFQSNLSQLGDVLTEKNAEKRGIRVTLEESQDLYKDAYGITGEDRAADRQVIRKIQEDSEAVDLGTFTDLNGNQIVLEMSKAEARKRYMEMQDPTLAETFTEGMGYTDAMKAAITNFLTPQDKAFAQSQLDFYQRYYDGINEVYRDIYGVDLPRNEFYSPIRREGVVTDDIGGFGEFLQQINLKPSVAPGSTKSRTNNLLPLRQQSDLSVLEQHMSEMEHFKAWANKVRELQAIFGNPEVRTAIKIFHGNDILGVVDNFISDFTRGGAERAGQLRWIDKWRGRIARSVLSLKASIGVKQLTSFVAFADAIPVGEFVKGTVDFWKAPIEHAKFIKKHSELLKTRGQNMERDIQTALKTDEFTAWRKSQNFLNTLMLNVQIGDQGAIVAGGWPVIKYHMDKGASIEEAIRKFESVTESTQQSADLSELSVFQRGGSLAKLFTMFLSSPNQYFRKEVGAIRNLFAGRQSVTQTAKTLAIFHVLLPVLFQFVSDGFTWDEDEELRAVILGPLNGIFILGDILDGITRKALGLRVFDDEVPVLSVKDDAIKAMKLISPDDLDAEETMRAIRGFAGLIGSLTGAPLKTAVDIGTGVDEILTGDFDKGAAQFLGWSPSVVGQKAKDKRRRR